VRVRVVAGHAIALPADDASFDAAVASLVLCSVSDVGGALAEIQRVLKPAANWGSSNMCAPTAHTKRWLVPERDGKAYRYWPTLTREQHSARLMREVLDSGGRSDLVLSHFLEQISPEESARRAALQRPARRTRCK
jgi:ubiquinone/menaquinone biosynthesis C-methylase UbiE